MVHTQDGMGNNPENQDSEIERHVILDARQEEPNGLGKKSSRHKSPLPKNSVVVEAYLGRVHSKDWCSTFPRLDLLRKGERRFCVY